MANILEASYNGTKKTYLMYHCNLSFRQLKNYLYFMLNKKLLFKVSDDGNPHRDLFKITDKGRRFLKAYENLRALMS